MKCYFCNNELKRETGHSYPIYESCDHCTSEYELHNVLTCQDEDGSVIYAHIYPDEQKFVTIYSGLNIPGSNLHFPSNRTYHIRLNLKHNTTDIHMNGIEDYTPLLHLPGLPIKPSNARDKLKLYLLFS